MPTALFLSPHLDDVAFSCGGLAALMADAGWHTVLATVFTRSVVPASGFALACQLDKGLAAEVDYMALRRREDEVAAAALGVTELRWLDLLEAPHRNYGSAQALFGPLHHQDVVAFELGAALLALAAELRPHLVLAPQGLGNHVDHQQVLAAAVLAFPSSRLAFYRDTPYAIRNPAARPLPQAADGASVVDITAALPRKLAAVQAYATQLGFQFGGPEAAAEALRRFAFAEGGGVPAERFSGAPIPPLDEAAAAPPPVGRRSMPPPAGHALR